MKKANLAKLRSYIGQKVRVTRRHVYQTSIIEGILTQVEKNGIFIKQHEGQTFSGGGFDSGRRYVNKSHLISVKTADGKVFK